MQLSGLLTLSAYNQPFLCRTENMFYETCFWVSIRRIIKAFEPRLLIHNGFSLVYHINSICCFSKRVYTVKRFVLSNLKSPSLKSNHGKAEVTSKIIHFVRILEWSYDKRRNTKFLNRTGCRESPGDNILESSPKRLLQGNISFQIWTFEKWELLNDNDHSLVLMNKFFLCLHRPQRIITSWDVFPYKPCNSPVPTSVNFKERC